MCLWVVYQVAACPKRDSLDEIDIPLRVSIMILFLKKKEIELSY